MDIPFMNETYFAYNEKRMLQKKLNEKKQQQSNKKNMFYSIFVKSELHLIVIIIIIIIKLLKPSLELEYKYSTSSLISHIIFILFACIFLIV